MAAVLQPWQILVATLAGWMGRQQDAVIEYLREENRVLNILRWHRRLIAEKWTHKRRSPGRPQVMQVITELVVRMAHENPRWGYTRIQGALANVGHRVSRGTVINIMKRNGIDPAPERGKKTSWRTFLAAHWSTIAATDFFTIEIWTARGLVTHYVLFVIHHATRTVHIAGMTTNPDSAFMAQVARNLTDSIDGFVRDKRFLILDNDSLFTAQFERIIENAGVRTVRTAYRAPDMKGYASHCTSCRPFDATSGKRRRSSNLRPCILTGASSPSRSNRHSFLSLCA